MGFTIAYRGKVRTPELVPELLADVGERARLAGWTREPVDPETGLTGFTLALHPQCERLELHFDPEGVITNRQFYRVLRDTRLCEMMADALGRSVQLMRQIGGGSAALAEQWAGPDVFADAARQNLCFTGGAGPDVHVAVCELLQHIQRRYAPELVIEDDSGYLATGDYARLAAEMAREQQHVAESRKKLESLTAGKPPAVALANLLTNFDNTLTGPRRGTN